MEDPKEKAVYAALDALGIRYVRHEHPAVFTVEEARAHWAGLAGTHCKNLFVRNKKGNRHYLVVVESARRVDLKALARALGEETLSFASPERLAAHLGLTPGSVSPYGLVNDAERKVEVVLDADLGGEGDVWFHPNVNTASIGVRFPDFLRFLESRGNPVRRFHAAP
jgi:Ala-tRNA(Pro) deacylase